MLAFSKACGVTATVDTVIGGNNPNICTALGGCVEALLDIEYVDAVANPIPLTVIYSSTCKPIRAIALNDESMLLAFYICLPY